MLLVTLLCVCGLFDHAQNYSTWAFQQCMKQRE